MKLHTIMIIALGAILYSEACIPPPGSPTTTTQKAATTTKATTTTTKTPTLKFVIVDFIGKAVTNGKVVWEKSTECPDTAFTIKADKTASIEYTDKCGKLKTIDGEVDGKKCGSFATDTAQPIPIFYLKTKASSGDGNCEFASSPRILE